MIERFNEIKEKYVSYSDIATNKNSEVLEDIHYLIAFSELKINQLEKEKQSLQYKVETYEKVLKNSQAKD